MTRLRLPDGPALVLCLLGCLWALVILMLVVLNPAAISVSTVTTILQFSTILALVALGQALVILAGGAGIDLSVGGTVSLSAIIGLLLTKAGLPPLLLPPACILAGLLLGLFNGFLVTKLAIPPLIATLGTLFVYSGTAVAITGGAAQSGTPDWLLAWGRGVIYAVPVPFLTLALPAFAVAILLLGGTSWGRWIYAMGFNERSARLVGIPVNGARTILYGLSGALAGAAGLVSVAWLGSGRPNIGQNRRTRRCGRRARRRAPPRHPQDGAPAVERQHGMAGGHRRGPPHRRSHDGAMVAKMEIVDAAFDGNDCGTGGGAG
jgi:ribose transport system permease protein